MARLQLCDGRKRLYQWDTGVEIEICECKTVTECHFVTPSGLVKGEVTNNICKVPDSALTHPGCLIVYAFARDGVYGTTRHDFRINVIARPKPADYIDATDESTTIDAIVDRLKILPECKGEKGDKGDQGDVGAQGDKGDKGDKGNDAVIDATLTQAGQAADAAKTGEEIGQLKDDLYIEETGTLLDNLDGYTGVATKISTRFFLGQVVKAGYQIGDISVYLRYYTGKLIFEIWEKDGNTLTLNKTVEYGGTSALSSGTHTVTLDYKADKDSLISIRGTVDGSGLSFNTGVSGDSYSINNIESDTLDFSTFIKLSNKYCMKIPYTTKESKVDKYNAILSSEILKVKGSIIYVGETGDYSDIQTALEYCEDSAENPVTLVVMPGIYPRFSLVRTLDNMVDGPANIARERYVSIIGVNKHDCVIRSDDGEYYMPAAEIRTNGLIKGLTFISTHDNPRPVSERRTDKNGKAYAVHSDFGTEKVTYEDCAFISYQAPAVGIGMYQGKEMIFRDCDFSHLGDTYTAQPDGDWRDNYTYTANYGALYAHGNSTAICTGEKITLDGCRFRAKNSDKGLWLASVKASYDEEMIINAMNCMAVCAEGGTKFFASKYMILSEEGYGNNFEFKKQL